MTEKQSDPLANLSDGEVRILPPDYTLKHIVGDDTSILSPENVEKAQQVINDHKENFLEWVMKDIDTLEQSYQAAKADMAASAPHIKKLARAAFVIKSQAGTFGFEFATHIAKSLDDFCNDHFKPDEAHMTVIRKHIDTLSLIFHKNITGEANALGKELRDTLYKLVEKYK
jgi:chemotaxis protein histidine kinase CheA